MSKEIYTIDQIGSILNPVFRRHQVKKAVLFGSYVTGTATETSDVDLMVDSGLKGLRFVGLVEDARNAVDKDIDMFDVTHIEKNSEIDTEIKHTGVVIYEK
ncbi:MAG: nucleotidyltransferase domain-containing protein [Lachnospiraceae bacterium]|nr:nucleotidyltransferase domain-containing protein [Lachnospiraceae bacterium]